MMLWSLCLTILKKLKENEGIFHQAFQAAHIEFSEQERTARMVNGEVVTD